MVLRKRIGSLMFDCCMSFVSDSEKNLSFPHLHGRSFVYLNSLQCHAQRCFASGGGIRINQLEKLRRLSLDVIGQLGEFFC